MTAATTRPVDASKRWETAKRVRIMQESGSLNPEKAEQKRFSGLAMKPASLIAGVGRLINRRKSGESGRALGETKMAEQEK